jgi:predicted TPR repeat methyltransferase
MKKNNVLLAYTLYYPGVLAKKINRPALAAKLVGSAIRHKEDVAEFHNALGTVLREQGKFREASICCERALAMQPKYAEALCNLGICLREQGRPKEAESHYRKALALQPKYAEAHCNLGTALRDQGRQEEAAKHYRQALALKPKYAEARNGLGVVLARWGKMPAAIAHFTRALTIDPVNAEAYYNLGCALQAVGRINEAVIQYKSALALRPDYAHAWNNLGALIAGIDPAASEAHFRRAVAFMPDLAEAHNALGTLLARTNRPDEAIASYRRAVAVRPDFDEAHFNLGFVSQSQGRFNEASVSYNRALEINPRFTDAQAALDDIRKRIAELESEAARQIQALAGKPDDHSGHDNLRIMLFRLNLAGQQARAANIAEEWLRICPSHPVARHLLSAIKGEHLPRAADEYIETTFDPFSGSFDQLMVDLGYQAPELLGKALSCALPHGLDVLDIGCGTGLGGLLLRPLAKTLTGVDLSQGMLAQAAKRKIYDQLHQSEIMTFLAAHPSSYDLIAATDVLIYFGELAPVLAWAKTALRPEGWIGFTLEKDDLITAQGWRLQPTGRYCHTEDYIRRSLAAAGLALVSMETCILRKEADKDVYGLLVLARQAPASAEATKNKA